MGYGYQHGSGALSNFGRYGHRISGKLSGASKTEDRNRIRHYQSIRMEILLEEGASWREVKSIRYWLVASISYL